MTGYDIYKKALIRLGYPEGVAANNDERLFQTAKEFINIICKDLKLPLIKNIGEEINLSDEVLETLCCGVCMVISRSEGDKSKCDLYTTVYNFNRSRELCKTQHIKDTLPHTVDGGQ